MYLKAGNYSATRLAALLENQPVGPENQALSTLMPLTIERHRWAIKELRRIWDENCDEVQLGGD
jgi:hypothetical protein